MDRLDEIRTLFDKAIERDNPDLLATAVGAWKAAAEAEKAELESAKLRRESKSRDTTFWTTAAPAISAIALVLTLIFQAIEFRANAQAQRDLNDDASYRAALSVLSDTDRVKATVVGIPTIKTYLKSDRLGGQARGVASAFVLGISDYRTFESLFNSIDATTTVANYRDLVNICSGLDDRYDAYQGTIEAADYEASSTKDIVTSRHFASIAATDKSVQEQINSEIYEAEQALQNFVRGHNKDLTTIDFSEGYLGYLNFSNLDLSGSNFRSASVYSVNLSGTRLDRITSYDYSTWDNSAWWHATAISTGLLTYLEHKKPFSAKAQYRDQTSAADYWSNIRRLDSPAMKGS